MKKKLMLLLVAAMTVAMVAGCGEKQEEQTGTQVSQETESAESTESVESTETGTGYSEDVISPFAEDVEIVTVHQVDLDKYVTVGDYKGLEFSYPAKGSYTKADVEDLLWNAYVSYVTEEVGGVKDRAAESGDWINLDYVGTLKGEAFEGGSSEGSQLQLGSGSFIAGFEEGLVGVMPGETVDLNLKFPEVYNNNPELAGQAVVFTVTINFIYPKDESEMVDEVVASMEVDEYTTVKELKQYCEWYLDYEVVATYESGWQSAALTALSEITEISEIPEGLQKKYYEDIYQSMKAECDAYGININDFCTWMYGTDAATYLFDYSEATATQAMMVYYVAQKEDLKIDDAEYKAGVKEFAERNHVDEEVILADYPEEDLREYLLFNKVLWFLVENGKVTETK